MGYYINPPDRNKEQFLKDFGKVIFPEALKDFDFGSDKLPVCLVDNRAFTAAAIAFSKRELEVFLSPDHRKKVWYIVSKKDLEPYYKD